MTDLDEAFERFALTDFEYRGGLANHGPMAAEALTVLGHGSLTQAWVDVYAPRLPPRARGAPIPAGERAVALGRPERLLDWAATFEAELAEVGWRELFEVWVERLLPGVFAGAGHGLLRVSHALRALDAADTAPRRRELALGLAYWAGRQQRLPGLPGSSARAGCGPQQAFEGIAVVPPSRRRPGLFFDSVRVLDGVPEFARQVDLLDVAETEPLRLLHEICRCAAELYLAHPSARIAYVHCLTIPSALRLLAPHLGAACMRQAIGFALQAALALHAVSAAPVATAVTPEVEKLAGEPAEIRYRAACSLEEHAIKFTEACLRENAVEPSPVFALAAADAAIHLDSGAGRGAAC
jgi:hypothetical protein